MDIKNYKKEDFDALSIHVLRIIAREVGVEAPTTKTKAQLVGAIIEKRDSGQAKPPVEGTQKQHRGKGRPPKQEGFVVFNSGNADELATKVVTEPEKSNGGILSGITLGVNNAFLPDAEEETASRYPAKTFKRPTTKQPYKKSDEVRNEIRPEGNGRKTETVTESQPSKEETAPETLEIREGILEIMPDGYGFLRAKNYESGVNDAYVSPQKIKRYMLRKGDKVRAETKQTCENKPAGVVNVLTINGIPAEKMSKRPYFDTLTPIYPDVRYRLEIPGQSNDFAIRSIDLIAPIGKGQRAMIVSPPKAGKTTLLKKVAHSITANYPDAHLLVLLIDERPEEVTDMQRSIEGEVVYSTFDEMPEHHTKAAELVLERAKRLVEMGSDVVILMDSLTRLARAYNLTISPTGRTLSGGIDPGALHSPKRFFGAARNIENGGSLTIIATALIDTGSRMDDVIYEEFKGTGNMEIHLDRRLSEKRIFPAIDLNRSGTRREELLLDQSELQGIWAVRKLLSSGGEGADATENLLNMMIKTKTNKEFIQQVNLQVVSMQKQGFLV